MMKRFSLIFLSLLLVISSCDSTKVFESNYDFEENSWNLDTIPTFEFQIEDALPKNVIINLRNSISYPYQNLYLSYTLTDSLDNELESGLIDLQLFDQKTGKPFGKGNSLYEHQNKVLTDFTFPHKGKYKLAIAQYMREIDLKEIASVGLRVEDKN